MRAGAQSSSRARAGAFAAAALVVVVAIAGSAFLFGGSDEVVATAPPAPPTIEPAPSEPTIERVIDPSSAPEPASQVAAIDVETPEPVVRPTMPRPEPTEPGVVPTIASPPDAAPSRRRGGGIARTFDERDETPSTGLATEW